jgi:hypothetical protein
MYLIAQRTSLVVQPFTHVAHVEPLKGTVQSYVSEVHVTTGPRLVLACIAFLSLTLSLTFPASDAVPYGVFWQWEQFYLQLSWLPRLPSLSN